MEDPDQQDQEDKTRGSTLHDASRPFIDLTFAESEPLDAAPLANLTAARLLWFERARGRLLG